MNKSLSDSDNRVIYSMNLEDLKGETVVYSKDYKNRLKLMDLLAPSKCKSKDNNVPISTSQLLDYIVDKNRYRS